MKKLILTSLLLASACATETQFDASGDILEFARGLRDNDSALIARHIYAPSLKSEAHMIARKIILTQTEKNFGKGAAVLGLSAAKALDPLIDQLADEALDPQNLAFFAHQAGLKENKKLPGEFEVLGAIKPIADNRVCVIDPDSKQCVLYFNKFPDDWKLVAISENALLKRLSK